MRGLFVEHFQNYQTVWLGNDGSLYFYQSELPYNVPSLTAWHCSLPDGLKNSPNAVTQTGCAALYLGKNVINFVGRGIGIYSYLLHPDIAVSSVIMIPRKPGANGSGIDLRHMVVRFLGSTVPGDPNYTPPNSHMQHIVYDYGYGISYPTAKIPTPTKYILGYALDGV